MFHLKPGRDTQFVDIVRFLPIRDLAPHGKTILFVNYSFNYNKSFKMNSNNI